MSEIVQRLKGACVGHPAAEIPWPHRLLHDAADEIARLTALIEEHNKKCSRIFCAYPRCSEREFQRCEKCPLDMMIDTDRKES